ncbi:Uncharacterized protein dnm_073760 [Desulfonema magnum]|uniref:Uncharacterized protein n=1 Tax=Desulfonema magnum TaxID=45655 RepID=A0A975BU15_9BACT|nr:Uncharacterized protein dnm_073760 [Desulfonema magnum]
MAVKQFHYNLLISADRNVFGLSQDRQGGRGRNPGFSGGGSDLSWKKSRVSLPRRAQSGNFSIC